MKVRVTKKAIKENYKPIWISYCGLQSLLRFENEAYYTTRAEGWGMDIYTFGNYAICTGYDSLTGAIRPAYEVVKKYETKAQRLQSYELKVDGEWVTNPDYIRDYDELRDALRVLIDEFITEIAG